jgi:hypothetical protein
MTANVPQEQQENTVKVYTNIILIFYWCLKILDFFIYISCLLALVSPAQYRVYIVSVFFSFLRIK